MATSWTTPSNTVSSWSNQTATPALTYAQASTMAYNEAGRTYNATEQTGGKKLYNGILSQDVKAASGPPTSWT